MQIPYSLTMSDHSYLVYIGHILFYHPSSVASNSEWPRAMHRQKQRPPSSSAWPVHLDNLVMARKARSISYGMCIYIYIVYNNDHDDDDDDDDDDLRQQ